MGSWATGRSCVCPGGLGSLVAPLLRLIVAAAPTMLERLAREPDLCLTRLIRWLARAVRPRSSCAEVDETTDASLDELVVDERDEERSGGVNATVGTAKVACSRCAEAGEGSALRADSRAVLSP